MPVLVAVRVVAVSPYSPSLRASRNYQGTESKVEMEGVRKVSSYGLRGFDFDSCFV